MASVVLGAIDILMILHLITSYRFAVRPDIIRYISESKLNNTVDGANWLAYFSVLANLAAATWVIALGCTRLASKRKSTMILASPYVAIPITLYMVTNFILCFFPMFALHDFFAISDGGVYFYNIIHIFQHFIMPLFVFGVFITCPYGERASKSKIWPTSMIFPLLYLIVSLIRGEVTGWYAYPIFDSEILWERLMPNQPFDAATAGALFAGIIIGLIVFFIAASIILALIYNAFNNKTKDGKTTNIPDKITPTPPPPRLE